MRIENLSKTYGGIRALDDFTVELPTGEAHALLGANGAGKSTLVKIIAGVVSPDRGVVEVAGERFNGLTSAAAAAAGIHVAHQELAIFPQLTVAEHLVVGRRVRRSERPAYLRRYEELFDEWGLDVDLSSVVRDMSPTLQATVSLARALEGDARFLILDEPSAALGPREVAGLFRIVRRKVEQGTGVVWVSHRLREVSELCSSATVMRNGAKVYSGPIGHMDEDELADLITAGAGAAKRERPAGASAAARLPRPPRNARGDSAESLLSVRNLRLSKSVADVSFDVAPGEVVGLAGLVGAGRTETLEALVGLRPIVDGSITLGGEPYRPRSPHQAVKRGVMLVPEERASQALFLERDVGFNLASARFRSEGRGRGGWRAQRRSYDETSRELVEALNIRTAGLDAPVSSLSGGNQQKVVLGRVMLESLTLLLLDEPTRGVDVGARRDFERIIRQLGDERGVGVVYVASELGELEYCDRVVVVVEGETTIEYHPEAGFDEEELTRLCFVPRQAEGALR